MNNKQKYDLIFCIFGNIIDSKYRNQILKINETWAEHAKNKNVKLIYFLGEKKPNFETIDKEHIEYVYLKSVANDYNSATYKQNYGLKYIYEKYDCDFVHVCGTDTYILVDNLLSNNYLDLYSGTYGIYIPANEILNRLYYQWFARLSTKQVVESDTIIGNYILLSISPQAKQGILEPLKVQPKNWVGFWRTPLQDLYGVKPYWLGDNMLLEKYPRR